MKRKMDSSSAHSRASGNPAARADSEAGSPLSRGRADVRTAPRPRARPDQNDPAASKPRARAASRLAAEVERLEAELAATQVRVAELESRADVDPLTDTFNRRGFERELKRSLAYVKRYGASVALVYLDLDEFKPVNDRHGHAAGDAVLKAVAATLTRHVRASDALARIGGDEFALLLWNISGKDAAIKAAALEAAIYSTHVAWGASTLVVSASAGVAFLGALDAPAEVLACADAAMYARKGEKKR
jgi:diguanylate cyclase (GGDEF)-like protein